MANATDALYELLPAIYRERDEELGGPLRALLRIVQEQSDLLEADIRQLWDNFFIETAEPWVIPYLGDLVGTVPLFDRGRVRSTKAEELFLPDLTGPRLAPEVALRNRADVAKTIYYRRRKGTLPMLEELARDVTGWGAHAVEFFELLGWTQHVRNHLRTHSPRTPDLRRHELLDRLDGPFDEIAHTVDVRPISQLTGWHNIKNIGFFLWRLRSHEAENVQARRVGVAGDYRYHFSPLGNPAPLFTRWRREGDEAGLATELHVPGPIRPAAFQEDLHRYRALPLPRRGFSEFYGPFDDIPGPDDSLQAPASSLMIFRDGHPVPAERIVSRNLESWSRPPAGFRGLVSGSLAPFPALTSANPEMDLTLGGETRTVALAAVPADLGQTQTLLEEAIRRHASLAFRGARVVDLGDRLLVIPGTGDGQVAFAPSTGDPTTIAELALDAGMVQTVEGVLSGRLHPFPRITHAAPAVAVTLGPETRGAALGSAPKDLEEARNLLETAIQGADPSPRFAGARVLALADRLLVLSGNLGERVRFAGAPADATTAEELALLNRVGVDPARGRIVFPLGEEPSAVDVYYHYGFSADLGGGSYPRRAWLVRRAAGAAHDVIQVDQSGMTTGAVTSLGAALLQWEAGGKKNTVISILDSRTYPEAIQIEPADGRWLAIEAADGVRPHLRLTDATASLRIVGVHPGAAVTLSGLLIEGAVRVSGDLGRLRILHSTLVPGRSLTEAGAPQGALPSLLVDPGPAASPRNTGLRVEIAFSVTGALRIPGHAKGLWVLDSVVDGLGTYALRGRGAGNPPGPPAWLERVTLLGASHVRELPMASEVIFAEPVVSDRRQEGCVRFSFVPDRPGNPSKTPRRYRCQPDLEIAVRIEEAEKKKGSPLTPVEKDPIRAEVRGWLEPSFTSLRYGQPAYAQLHLACPRQILTGAEDGSEMGVFCHLKQPQREANLRFRLEEYLPFGLEPGILYVT